MRICCIQCRIIVRLIRPEHERLVVAARFEEPLKTLRGGTETSLSNIGIGRLHSRDFPCDLRVSIS